ncbi:hypothetical protein EHF33_20705 (plasmid) [Deinococcus psychrotolerans]|uniref:Uncharacterized protein n=1 Tax=Deinococcus psychrotolerans TaxID=2489213 RepID=A0A3G8YK60_9DEIO|nr:hypothetical protein [Deinococcus psychrotolerans]AZI45333.1 hypothetical protein EHF33_20705 [Deinococcus psychrotolerans]
MTQPAFAPWTSITNDNRAGYLLWGQQDAPAIFKPPTRFMKETGGGKVVPDYVTTEDKFFAGSLFTPQSTYQGAGFDGRTANVEMDAVTLALSMIAMFGPADGTSKVITPNGLLKWSDDLVTAGLSMDWYQPTVGHTYVTDGQLHELDVTIPQQRDIITGTLSFHGRKAVYYAEGVTQTDYVVAAPVVPGYGLSFGRLNSYIKFGGVDLKLDGASTLKVMRPIDPLSPLGEFTAGYKPGTGNIGAEITAIVNGGRPDLIALMKNTALTPVIFGLVNWAGQGVEFTMQAGVTAVDAPLQTGAVQTNLTLSAKSSAPGVVPFTIKLLGTIPGI